MSDAWYHEPAGTGPPQGDQPAWWEQGATPPPYQPVATPPPCQPVVAAPPPYQPVAPRPAATTSTSLVPAASTALVPVPHAAALEARHLSVALPNGTVVVDDISLRFEPGTLVAVVGPTGAGKSTFLKAITGASPPSFGQVVVAGHDLFGHLEQLRPKIGSVPQDDIVHTELTIRDALTFGIELRSDAAADPAERAARVVEVMQQLGLDQRADVPISKLSGGQRKRASVALELLGEPSVIVLDEPTSGLDPGFEQSVMALFRALADAGKAIVVVTHAVASLELCDQVVFLAPGGRLAYAGPPANALAHFGARDYPEVFRYLSERAVPNRQVDPATIPPPDDTLPTPLRRNDWRADLRTLVLRQIAVLQADRRNLAFLVGAPLVLAALILMVVGTGALDHGAGVASTDGRILLGSLAVAACALGASNAVREIVREESLYLRERALGVERLTYLASKFLVTGVVTIAQIALLVLITTIPSGANLWGNVLPSMLEMILAFGLTGLATVAVGLVVSAVVSSSEKAMTIVPVLFVVCYLFSGAAVDLQSQPAMKAVSYAVPASWGVSAAASSVDLPTLNGCGTVAPDGTTTECDGRWSSNPLVMIVDLLALLLLIAAGFGLAEAALARKEPLPAMRRDFLLRRAWLEIHRRFAERSGASRAPASDITRQ